MINVKKTDISKQIVKKQELFCHLIVSLLLYYCTLNVFGEILISRTKVFMKKHLKVIYFLPSLTSFNAVHCDVIAVFVEPMLVTRLHVCYLCLN